MIDYEARQQAKKERLKERAKEVRAQSDSRQDESRRLANQMEFGQPILVGHHSERRHRSDLEKARRNMDKAIALSRYANDLEARAEAVGTGGISSDDPEAVDKLERKLLEKQEAHAFMVAKNKDAREMGQPSPFMAYQLSNSNNNIRSIKQRIEQLQRTASRPAAEPVTGDGWTMTEEDNRIMFIFDGKPSEERRALLKANAFLWSPSRGAWVRKITPNARYAVKHFIIPKL